MTKEEVLALVADKKLAAGSVFDDISSAISSIEISIVGGDAELQKQLDQAKADLAGSQAELEALKTKEAEEAAKLASDEVDLETVKADLQDKMAKLQKDEDAIAKFKAILADLQNA